MEIEYNSEGDQEDDDYFIMYTAEEYRAANENTEAPNIPPRKNVCRNLLTDFEESSEDDVLCYDQQKSGSNVVKVKARFDYHGLDGIHDDRSDVENTSVNIGSSHTFSKLPSVGLPGQTLANNSVQSFGVPPITGHPRRSDSHIEEYPLEISDSKIYHPLNEEQWNSNSQVSRTSDPLQLECVTLRSLNQELMEELLALRRQIDIPSSEKFDVECQTDMGGEFFETLWYKLARFIDFCLFPSYLRGSDT